ncbi:uncharacterized protein LOC141929920 [Strix aluco]|uniref:uncharacterized protein LOC141929920 n=1 Tax=Strix aluco TaxID=111821 RepID=UPI003DA4553A
MHLGRSPLHSQTASVHPGSACVTPSAGEDSQATGVSEEEEGQEEGRRKKHLTRQILPAVPRTRAAFQGVVGPDDLQEFPSHLKPFCSSGVTTVTSRAVSYHRREKVAPGFKAIPSACCFTPAAALLKKRRSGSAVVFDSRKKTLQLEMELQSRYVLLRPGCKGISPQTLHTNSTFYQNVTECGYSYSLDYITQTYICMSKAGLVLEAGVSSLCSLHLCIASWRASSGSLGGRLVVFLTLFFPRSMRRFS